MKKIFKNPIFTFILGAIIFGSIGIVSASILYQADEVGFTPDDPNWNVNNLGDALNDLYNNKNFGTPDKILNGLDGMVIDDEYSMCVIAVARASSSNYIKLNNVDQTPLYTYYHSNGAAGITLHVLENLHLNDQIDYISNGVAACYK